MESIRLNRRAFAGLGLGLGAFALTGAPSFAAEELGPPIGGKAPDIGTPQDQTGKARTLQSLMGEKGVVLFFFRSASWCPFCQAQMMDLNTGVADIAKRGYKLAGISYETPEKQVAFIERRGIKYDLLCDPGSVVIDRWRLRDPQYKPDSFAYGVPRPIIFVIGRDGVIKDKLYEETYTKRPPLKLVIETLDKAAAKGA
jgi:peroxiredoxin